MATKTIYAVGAFGQGGYEKIVEINSQHPEYVMFSLSGYNGAFRKLKYAPGPQMLTFVLIDNLSVVRRWIFCGTRCP